MPVTATADVLCPPVAPGREQNVAEFPQLEDVAGTIKDDTVTGVQAGDFSIVLKKQLIRDQGRAVVVPADSSFVGSGTGNAADQSRDTWH